MFKKKKCREKNDCPIACSALTTSLFPTEGMIVVVAYLVTCWPDLRKKLKFSLRIDDRTEEKKMEPSSLISCHRLSSNLPFFVSPFI